MTGTSSFLPVSVRGMSDTATIASGTWRELAAKLLSDPLAQGVVDLDVLRDDEQQQLADPALRVLEVNDQRLGYLGQAFDHRVELARAEPHPASVQGRVRAPGEHAAPPLGEADPVALTPYTGVAVEVGLAQARSVRVVPSPTGIEGIGLRITSSPSSPITSWPSGSKACASTPRQGPEISPS